MKHFITFIFICFTASFAFSQTARINGKVIDKSTNEPVPYAAVVIQGTTNGQLTDFDGLFSFDKFRAL